MMMSCLWKPLIGLLTTFELIRDTPVDFKAHLKHTASLCNIMVKSKEISQDIRKRIVNLHKSSLVHSWVQFPGATFICSNNYMQV